LHTATVARRDVVGGEAMEKLKFYIDGAWVDPATPASLGI